MKLGKDIDLDELLQKHSLVDFVSGCLQFSKGGPFRGRKSPESHLSESQLSGHIKITTESLPEYLIAYCVSANILLSCHVTTMRY